ncbi:MAG: FAD:protein FMN transferase [Peptococcaceae bacterium]|nr:FAD:protein FMN transferase [Peptococcaceae bacterium]
MMNRRIAFNLWLCLTMASLLCLAGGCAIPQSASDPALEVNPEPSYEAKSDPVRDAKPVSAQNFMLDTLITITLYDSDDRSMIQKAFDEISRLESALSAAAMGSDPDRLTQNAGKDYIQITGDTLYLLEEGARFSAMSDGAFDCTVGPLVSLWGIRDSGGYYPSEDEREAAMAFVNYKDVLIRGEDQAMLKNAGMKVDFGAIAKGYIADKVKDLLVSEGIGSAVLDLGGNIVLIGRKPDGAAFRIGVRDPMGDAAEYFAVFEIANKCLVSSGSYERYFTHQGSVYHHILDVRTGFPADNELLQVTIVSDLSVMGDGFSTTAFLLGLDRGLALLNETEGVEGVFVTKDKKVYVTNGIGGEFRIVSNVYALADKKHELL